MSSDLMNDFPITKTLSIKECEKDERWLHEIIYKDPTILGLGNLQLAGNEIVQPQGGRLDLLLKNDDDSMYEVEIQLGETDESHIIRTIEYWESEKRRWPNRSHTAVLIAETITSRFFQVVNLLSQSVPIIGIQVNIVQIGDKKALHFTKLIDSYEEPDDSDMFRQYNEQDWKKQNPDILEYAVWYKQKLKKMGIDVAFKYFKSKIALTIAGTARIWIAQRNKKRAFIEIKPAKTNFQKTVERLNTEDIRFGTSRNGIVTFNVDFVEFQENASIHEWLTETIKESESCKSRVACAID
ncbi:MAG: hypothetical protein HQM08_29750 [Candidatus Riflebacteria bacterium]|nr:hypothetical protein [Candidatus Riflebacteria bacterium]